jgi:hypothetical protein
MKRWDNCGRKGKRTPERLDILRSATHTVVSRNPELKEERGRLYSAVFAEIKRQGNFVFNHKVYKKPYTSSQYIKKGIWNEKEFFHKKNYLWTKSYITKYANETTLPLWVWILLAMVGYLMLRNLFKSK